jgi:cyclase
VRAFRIIPTLLLENKRLVKTIHYRKPRYIGDPINAVRIFNDKEVDELVLLDIGAASSGIRFEHIQKIVSEAFMPIAYGGGVRSLEDIRTLFQIGIEKVVLGTAAVETPDLVREASTWFGSQSIVVSVDVKTDFWGKRRVFYANAKRKIKEEPLGYAQRMVTLGAGEILLNDVDREGTMGGMDLDQIRRFSQGLDVPMVASGGAGSLRDVLDAWELGGAHAVSAGSLFVFKGPLRAVLINYPQESAIQALLSERA